MRATRRSLVVGLLIGAILIVGTATPVAGEYPEPIEVCDSVDQQRLMITFADGRTVGPEENISVYPGTEFRVLLCTDNDPELADTAWRLSSVDGVSLERSIEYTYVVTVQSTSQELDITLANELEGKSSVPAPGLTVFPGYVANTTVDDTIEVRFRSEQRYERYLDEASAYAENASTVRSISSRLTRTNESDVNTTWANRTVPMLAEKLNNSKDDLNQSHNVLERVIFESATAGNPGVARALDAYDEDRSRLSNESREAVTTQRRSLSDAARASARMTLGNFLGSLVIGALVGGSGGWYYTKRKLSDVEYLRSRTSAVDFDPRQIAVPLAVAGLLFIGAGAALVLIIGVTDLLAVIQSLL